MSNNYNFDEISQQDGPTILMGGYTYKLQYPTVGDIEDMGNLKTDEEKNAKMYSFVKKTEEGQPEFPDVLKSQSVLVLNSFVDMIKTEFGLQ